MKTFFTLLIISLLAVPGFSQIQYDTSRTNCFSDSIEKGFVRNPQEGGEYNGNMIKHFQTNLRYPKGAIEREVQGKVFISFIIEKDGKISELSVVKSADPDLDAESIRVLKLTEGNWIPGKINGELVRVKKIFPVFFKLPDDDEGRIIKPKKKKRE